SVIGKMTRSLSSSSGPKRTCTSSPFPIGVRAVTIGTAARRTVGSTRTLPSLEMVPDRNVSDETCPSPTARRLRMNRQPSSGAPVWSGCRTILGLKSAEASNGHRKFHIHVVARLRHSQHYSENQPRLGTRSPYLPELRDVPLPDIHSVRPSRSLLRSRSQGEADRATLHDVNRV